MPSVVVDTSTDDELIIPAPSSSQWIRIAGLDLTAKGAVDVTLVSGSTTIWKTYAMSDANSYGGIVLPISNGRSMIGEKGVGVTIGLSAAVAVAGTIEYEILGMPNNANS